VINNKPIASTSIVIIALILWGCSSNDDTESPTSIQPANNAPVERVYQCDSDPNNPLVWCWTVESCLDFFPQFSNNVYINFSYAFRKSGELIHRSREYDNSDCAGEPVKVVDDNKINPLNKYYELHKSEFELIEGGTAKVFKIHTPNNTHEINPVTYVSYTIDNDRLCLGEGLITGKFTDIDFQYPIETQTKSTETLNYENCMYRDQ